MRLALLEGAVVQQHPVAGQHRLAGGRAGQRRRVGGRGGRAVAAPGGETVQLQTGGADVGQADRPVHRVRQHAQHPDVGVQVALHQLVGLERGLEHPHPALPVQEGAGLLGDRRHRQHHVGVLGDRGRPQFQRDHERGPGQRLLGEGRVRQVVHADAADHQRVQVAAGRGGQDLVGVATEPGRQVGHPPDRGGLGPGGQHGHRAAAGEQAGQGARLHRAPLAGPARHPGELRPGRVGQAQRGGQAAGHLGEPLADQDHRAGAAQRVRAAPGVVGEDVVAGQCGQPLGLGAGGGGQQRAAQLAQAPGGVRGDREDGQSGGAVGLAQPQEDDRRLLLGLQPDQQDGGGRLQLPVGDAAAVEVDAPAGDGDSQEVGLLAAVRTGPEVHVVGAERDPGELGVAVRVLDGHPAAGQHRGARPAQALGGPGERLRPGGGDQFTVLPDHRGGEAVALLGVAEGEPALVAVPLLVHLRLVAGQPAQHLAAAVVGALAAAGRAVLAHARRGDQVERAGAEPVGGRGERADRADLDGVAGEVRGQRLVVADADLLEGAPLEQVDERVAGDLLREAGAAGAQHAAFAVQQHLAGERDRLLVGALHALEARLRVAGGHRLVLQRAFAALVADRAVQRVVDQQQFHHAALGLLGDR